MRRRFAFALVPGAAILLSLAAAYGREYPPAVPAPKPFVLHLPTLRRLSNGLRVVVVERHSLPLLTLRLEVRAGAEADPVELPGTARMVAGLLSEGTSRRSARQIAEAIDQVGGTIQTGAEWDESFAELSVLNDHAELAFDLLADMTINSAFAPGELERFRKQTLSALDVVRGDPSYVADAALRRIIFGDTPYGHPEDGYKESVGRLGPEDLREFHRLYYQPARSILAVVGDISVEEAVGRAEKYFGSWQGNTADPVAREASPRPGPWRVVVIDKPDAVQTEIRIASPGIRRASPDYDALSVANQILGGPAANRLFRALRSREGLTYGASSDLLCYRSLGGWVAKTSTRTSQTVRSVELALEQMKRLRINSLSDDELSVAKSYLVGHQALEFETSEGIAGQVLNLMLYDLPLDYWNRLPERIEALGANDVWETARRYLDPDHSVIVLVGNAAEFSKDLKPFGPLRVIPLADLDFASDNLERPSGAVGHR